MIAIITYNYPHLKTEQLFHGLIANGINISSVYAIPFLPRKKRTVLFKHRPQQDIAAHPENIAKSNGVEFIQVQDKENLQIKEEIAIVAIGAIIPGQTLKDTKVINCHSGIIPLVKGLDAFKWSIYYDKPLGVTLHYIDKDIDCGEILAVKHTPVYPSDTIESLARRHYEMEVTLNIHYSKFLDCPVKHLSEEEKEVPPNRRMPVEKEKDLLRKAASYIERHSKIFSKGL